MYPDFCHFILYRMGDVVQLEINIYLDDPVVKRTKLIKLFVHIRYQFRICIEVHRLNVNVHINRVLGETIKKIEDQKICTI